MKRKFTKYIVIVLAILLAELLHAYAHSFLHHWKSNASAYESVLVSMIVAVLVFYPAFHFIDKYMKYASEKYVQEKYERYKAMGQKGFDLERIAPSSNAILEKVNPSWFPLEEKKELVA